MKGGGKEGIGKGGWKRGGKGGVGKRGGKGGRASYEGTRRQRPQQPQQQQQRPDQQELEPPKDSPDHEDAADLVVQAAGIAAAPNLVKLRSSEGDLFEAEASALCQHSPLIQQLLEDEEEDEVPVPALRTKALGLLLDFCAKVPAKRGALRQAPVVLPEGREGVEVALELLWAVKLLLVERLKLPTLRGLALLLDTLRAGSGGDCGLEPPFKVVPLETLSTLLREAHSTLSLPKLMSLLSSVAERAREPELRIAEESQCLPFDCRLGGSEPAARLFASSAHEIMMRDCIFTIVTFLKHPKEEVRSLAESELRTIGTLDALRPLLRHKEFPIRMRTLKSLPRGCPDAVRLARELLDTPDEENAKPKPRSQSQQPEKQLGWENSGRLTEGQQPGMSCTGWHVREIGVQALTMAAPFGDPTAIDELAQKLEDRCREVREAAVKGLGVLALPDNPRTIAAVKARLAHEDWVVRGAALRALASVAPGDPELVERAAEEEMVTGSGATFARYGATRLLEKMRSSRCEPEAKEIQRGESSSSTEPSPATDFPTSPTSFTSWRRPKSWADENSDEEW